MNERNNQSVNQSINQASKQSIDQSTDRPIDQSVSQSINQSINQSVNQSVSQSINQSNTTYCTVRPVSRRGWCRTVQSHTPGCTAWRPPSHLPAEHTAYTYCPISYTCTSGYYLQRTCHNLNCTLNEIWLETIQRFETVSSFYSQTAFYKSPQTNNTHS